MNQEADEDSRTQQLLDRTLRRLPARRAPLALESRVLRELQRRAALPWWRRSFSHWPPIARAAFVIVSGALIAMVFQGSNWTAATVRSLHDSGALPNAAAHQAWALVSEAGQLAGLVSNAIPPAWLYLGLMAGAVFYATLFGLGAAAYRTLYLAPLDGK